MKMMEHAILFAVIGYLSGSILYANVFGALFGVREQYQTSGDRNPGASNAYKCGGFWCGTLTLIFDLLKGILPVYFCLKLSPSLRGNWMLSLALAAPVIGHAFPVFFKFHGGKGIATSFGCLLGLVPDFFPLLIFAASFIFFSVGVRISPNYYRTIAAYPAAVLAMILLGITPGAWIGFLLIALTVCLRLHMSKEEKAKPEVKLLWMH